MENKKILITGANSYIGTSFERWVSKYDRYQIDTINLRNDNWKSHDFSKYDSILHVAAIVHKKEKRGDEALYNEVNTELAYEVAKKAKKEGVKQFIFMSSIAVYGLEGSLFRIDKIDQNTIEKPKTLYGKSKLNAEKKINKLNQKSFKIAVLRLPMIYGPNCPGNYTRLKKFILKISFFPMIKNERSMLFIDNLSEFIKRLVESQSYGIFFPQNEGYVNVIEMVKLIAEENNKKLYISKVLGVIIRLLFGRITFLNKIFGNLVIKESMSNNFNFDYNIVNFYNSIKICEK